MSDLRTETAEGLAKLMYTGRISSAKMLSRLVLLWYNPVTEDDTRLRHCLGVFFQLYARESRSHKHTMSTLLLLEQLPASVKLLVMQYELMSSVSLCLSGSTRRSWRRVFCRQFGL